MTRENLAPAIALLAVVLWLIDRMTGLGILGGLHTLLQWIMTPFNWIGAQIHSATSGLGWFRWILYILLIVAAGFGFRAVGRIATHNAPKFRDMPASVAIGYVFGILLILIILGFYSVSFSTFGGMPDSYFFFRLAVHGILIGAIAAILFRQLGCWIGTPATRKLFRQMPATASFGIFIIICYSFAAIFAGQISVTVLIIVGVVCAGIALIVNQLRAGLNNTAAIFTAAVIFGIFVVMYFSGPIAPHGQEEVFPTANIIPLVAETAGGNPDFPLGTDQIGRDILSRLIYGAQNTVGIAFVTTVLAFVLGVTGGFLAATLRGWVDQALSRFVDVLMAIPALIFSLLLITAASSLFNGTALTIAMIVIIAVIDSTRVFRLSRAVGMNIVVMDYIEAAKLRGEGLRYLIFREILPNATAPLLAEFGLRFCFVFLTIAALSFLGLGIQPPLADWGTMVKDMGQFVNYASFLPQYAMLPLLPAGAIALLTVAVNFVVDWMLHKSSGLKE